MIDLDNMQVQKRDGRIVVFDRDRILQAISAAFKADLNLDPSLPLQGNFASEIDTITSNVVREIAEAASQTDGVTVETVQNVVEEELMRRGHFSIARRYILYRAEQTKVRKIKNAVEPADTVKPSLTITRTDGTTEPLDAARIRAEIYLACRGLEGKCSVNELEEEVYRTVYDGISTTDIQRAMVLAARTRTEREPSYDSVATRLLLRMLYREAIGEAPADDKELKSLYTTSFTGYLNEGVSQGRLDPELLKYDIGRLSSALEVDRDLNFKVLGLQTIYDRYLIHVRGRRIETPQYFWMRVAMGLALNEPEQTRLDRTLQFYEVLSRLLMVSATPTLFNAGTNHPQLSSCYLSTVDDDLVGIFKQVSDNARLSKWAGGLGNDWTPIRATGAHIEGTNGQSQGVIPFLKIVNDTAVAVNQGGKRKGAVCAYLETWHLDIEDFLELRKNTGDERRRTHDMNTANWIPDLFMKRVRSNSTWTLFSPNEVPDLHDLYGQEFEERYAQYETKARNGEIEQWKELDAMQLWRKMLSMLFETGHPWITFKDPSNIRSPQDHMGVVHSSNLCTEILLNTSLAETAVCNLGSINLTAHTTKDGLDETLLAETVRTGLRMLDNVIDINYYPTPEAKASNQQHRPIGMGIMGFQDALYKQRVSYASQEAVEFADKSMEIISFNAILASTELAAERGTYETYEGSKWDRGLLPIDTIEVLEEQRGEPVLMDRRQQLDWDVVRGSLAKHGMRNSNVMAIAPTATISNIAGTSQSIEPQYRNLYAKSNLSGDFTILNQYLVEDLKRLDLWDQRMIDDLKYYDGSVQEIDRVPDELKAIYHTASELDSVWLIECASRRQKWIDMGQSLNLYISQPSGKMLNDMYMDAWLRGLKTTYYLRAFAQTQIEKSSLDVNARAIQPRWMKSESASSRVQVQRESQDGDYIPPTSEPEIGIACDPFDEECEACQ